MTVNRSWRLPLIAVGIMLLLTACATQGAAPEPSVPGFWMGLIHGAIAPFALIGHVFDHSIRIYAVPNSGGWYDFRLPAGSVLYLGRRQCRGRHSPKQGRLERSAEKCERFSAKTSRQNKI